MRTLGRLLRGIRLPSSGKRDALFIPALFLVNSYFFSAAFGELTGVAADPWLILIMLYGLAGVLPLAWRDKTPVTVFIVIWAHNVAGWPILPRYSPVLGVAVALYSVSLHRGIKTSLLAFSAAFVPGFFDATTILRSDPELSYEIIVANAVIIFVLLLGAWIQGRLARASHQHIQRLERERETTREAVVEERRRIARELHDIVSHAVTVIVLQAAGAARVADTDLAQVKQSLAHVESTGKQAMTELRRLLGVLDNGDLASAGLSHTVDGGELGPQPGLVDVTVLLASLRATGMPVKLTVEGTPHNVDPSVDLAAYRIVQEGLTNVLKHAGKDSDPRLRLVWQPQDLLIQIDNVTNLTGAHRGRVLSVGRGLVGLRERVQAVGGCLSAGPHHQGYRLTATLPHAGTAGGVVAAMVVGGDQGRGSA
ncbi:MAG: sensor histidine kinase [Pseudonocardiaceae bacterium]